jgi:hypothetical protein
VEKIKSFEKRITHFREPIITKEGWWWWWEKEKIFELEIKVKII